METLQDTRPASLQALLDTLVLPTGVKSVVIDDWGVDNFQLIIGLDMKRFGPLYDWGADYGFEYKTKTKVLRKAIKDIKRVIGQLPGVHLDSHEPLRPVYETYYDYPERVRKFQGYERPDFLLHLHYND
jgi:hypothetical protein